MKTRLTILLLLFGISSFGQENYSADEIPDCETVTHLTIDKIADIFISKQLDSFDIIINDMISICGVSECTQRLIILNNIMTNQSSDNSIQKYFENELQYVLINRIKDSRRINYGYIYADSKAYFGYVPLRHSIDSIVTYESKVLLDTNTLTPDERLICTLFTGNIENFEEELDKKEYDDSYVKQLLLKRYRDRKNSWIAYTIYTGAFKPISSDDVFNYSPMFGLSFSSPLSYDIIIEVGIKARINIGDDSFKYYALNDTNMVNSDASIFFGGFVGYKLYESEKLILIPKLGIGIESVDTGLSEKKTSSASTNYLNLETIHLSLGLSAMTPAFKRSYLGFGFNYHFCPYQIDKNLHTALNSNLLSAELFCRF